MKLALVGAERAEAYRTLTERRPTVSFTALANGPKDDSLALEKPSRAASLREVIETSPSSFDAVVIQSRRQEAVEAAKAAAAAGKHVLTSFPIAIASEELERLQKACLSAGVVLMVGNPMRFGPSHRELKRAADAGLFQVSPLEP